MKNGAADKKKIGKKHNDFSPPPPSRTLDFIRNFKSVPDESSKFKNKTEKFQS